MSDRRRATGRRGEELAAATLASWGWRIIETNWRCASGEIDIVAQDGDSLVLVEVRTRRGTSFGLPEESVGRVKQARLTTLGLLYIQACRWEGPWRIDLLAISLDAAGRPRRLVHYPHAVAASR
jgi:putative endonuclease